MWPATIRRLGPLLPGLLLLLLLWATAYVAAPPRMVLPPPPAAADSLSVKLAELLAGRSVKLNGAELAHLVPGSHLRPDGIWLTAGETALGPVLLRVRTASVANAQLYLQVDSAWVGWLPVPPAVFLRVGRDTHQIPAPLTVDLPRRALVTAWPFAPAEIQITANELVLSWLD